MIRHRLAFTMAGCLLFLAGIAHGGPVADQSGAPASASQADDVWGDPEAAEASGPGWTWFGMGYERRNRERIERTIEPIVVPDDGSGSSGKGRGSR